VKRAVLLLGLCGALACPLWSAQDANAQARPNKGRIMLYGSFGGARWGGMNGNPDPEKFPESYGVNDVLRLFEDDLRQDFILANYDVFVSSPDLGVGLLWQIGGRISLGAEYSYKKKTLTNDTFAEDGGRLLDVVDTWEKDLQFQVYFWPGIDDGIFIGGGGGMGWMWARQEITLTEPDTETQQAVGDWTASNPVFGAFAGYHFNFILGLHLMVKGGYNWLFMGMPEGSEQLKTGGTVEDFDLPLNNVDWDYSGFFARIQLGIGFFGKSDDDS